MKLRSSLFLCLVILILFLPNKVYSNEYLKSWIPSDCCVTNDCCWKISEDEVTLLPNQKVRINSTEQELSYNFSIDQNYYRCACDFDIDSRQWIKHQGANTRCLFVPNRGY